VTGAPVTAKQWYIIHTYSGFEDRVKKTLEQRVEALGMTEYFGEIQVPTETVVEIKNGKKREVRKFFSGLRSGGNGDDRRRVAPGAQHAEGHRLRRGKKPTLTEEEVNPSHQSVATQEKPRPKEVFDKGERIRIIDGPFASFNGVIEEVNLDRSTVKVMVTIFGRETPVEMEFRQVQKLS
jgi:transcriptional antiterminator NusG